MTYYAHSAALRVMDAPGLHDEITRKTGIEPSHSHKKGEVRTPKGTWENSIWMLESPLGWKEEMSAHLNWLWQQVAPHVAYLKDLKASGVKLDVFCGFRTDTDTGGFSIQPGALAIITELEIPIEVSVIVT
jgi:hypothetical protein